jgi:hypothetical protein
MGANLCGCSNSSNNISQAETNDSSIYVNHIIIFRLIFLNKNNSQEE